MYKVGIIGCGSVFHRHLEAIEANQKNFKLVSLCDVQLNVAKSIASKLNACSFDCYKKMIDSKQLNFVVIATPAFLHAEQAIYALERGCDVLIEKPIALNVEDTKAIITAAKANKQKAYCVLQVRLNPTIKLLKQVLKKNLLGNIRGVSLIQRWQRPFEFFSGWRSDPTLGGGILYECGIHYLDVLIHLLGVPSIKHSLAYQVKHKSASTEDTFYSLFDFGTFGGTCEITMAAEPQNLECSLSLLGSNGYIKIGGKSLNIIESAKFLSHGCQAEFDNLMHDHDDKKYKITNGSSNIICANHPELYANLSCFQIEESISVIQLISEMYKNANKCYDQK